MNYSNLIEIMESAWLVIQTEYPDVPNVLLTVATGGRRATNLYGHFSPNCWESDEGEDIHEVLIVAEQLRRSPEEIFTTLLHEAVHGIANKRVIKDVSGRRHNKRFRSLCEEVGMVPPEYADSSIGWSAATLSPALQLKFGSTIRSIGEALTLSRKLKLKEKDKVKTSWSAECECGRKIRIGKKALGTLYVEENMDGVGAMIDCGLCGGEFKVIDDD